MPAHFLCPLIVTKNSTTNFSVPCIKVWYRDSTHVRLNFNEQSIELLACSRWAHFFDYDEDSFSTFFLWYVYPSDYCVFFFMCFSLFYFALIFLVQPCCFFPFRSENHVLHFFYFSILRILNCKVHLGSAPWRMA